jgi:recombination DNA repair RAD52 pathway protein
VLRYYIELNLKDNKMEDNNKKISELVNVVVENVLASDNKQQALKESLKFFGKEIINFNYEDFRNAIHVLKDTLTDKVEEFTQPLKYGRELTTAMREMVALEINETEGNTSQKRNILIAAITDYDKYSSDSIETIANRKGFKR